MTSTRVGHASSGGRLPTLFCLRPFLLSNSPPPPLMIPVNRSQPLFLPPPSCQCRRLPIILFLATAHQFPNIFLAQHISPHSPFISSSNNQVTHHRHPFPPFISDYNSLSICFQPQPISFPTFLFNVFCQSLHQYCLRVKIRPVPSNIHFPYIFSEKSAPLTHRQRQSVDRRCG